MTTKGGDETWQNPDRGRRPPEPTTASERTSRALTAAESREYDRLAERSRLYGRLPVHQRRIAQATDAIRQAADLGPMAVMFSGGKDSMVVLHLVNAILGPTPAFFIDSGNETDYTHEAVALMRTLGYDVQTVHPEHTILDMLRMVGALGYDGPEKRPGDWHWLPRDYMEVLIQEPARRVREMGYPVQALGLRGQESRGRRGNMRKRGTLYRKANGAIVVAPINFWDADDVFAYLTANDLPISREYLQPEASEEERGRRRTSAAIEAHGIAFDRRHELRVRHRALWQELAAEFPAIRKDA